MRPSPTSGAHSSATLFVHLVWSTKSQLRRIDAAVEALLRELIARKCYELGGRLVAIGIAANHVHVLAQIAQKVAVSSLAHHLKGMTSRMISLQLGIEFGWQEGYWAESVGWRELPRLQRYLEDQRGVHAKRAMPDPPWVRVIDPKDLSE